jgi:hypothetical protein
MHIRLKPEGLSVPDSMLAGSTNLKLVAWEITNSMEQSPLWDADSQPASQFIETEGSLSGSQQPANGPYSDPDASSSQLPIPVP